MTGFSNEVREMIRQRASCAGFVLCEVMVRCPGRSVPLWDLHHRRPRGSGGSRRPETNWPGNALAVCRDCHNFIESHRTLAYANGWLVRQVKSPMDVPVLRRGVWVLLNNVGGIVPAAVPCRCGLWESEHLSPNCPCELYDPDAEAA